MSVQQSRHAQPIGDDEDEADAVADTLEASQGLEFDTDDFARSVVVVDDESHILKAVRRLFAEHDSEVITATDAQEAQELMREHSVAVLIADQRMPGMSGIELLDYARRHYPKTVRVMLTGNAEPATAIEAINEGEVFRFITKPWDREEFIQVVEMALDQYELQISKERYERHIEAQNEELRDLNTELRELNEELESRVQERTREVRESKREISELYRELRDSFDGMIEALMSIMELGESNVVDHCQRTAERVRQFGEHLDLDDDFVREIERAARLHWIGLINADSALFEKSISEFDAIEKATWEFHPLLGQQAIRHIPALRQTGRLILHYLERWDDPEFEAGAPSSDDEGGPLTDSFIRGCQVLAICSFFEHARTVDTGGDEQDWTDEGLESVRSASADRFDPDLVEEFEQLVGDTRQGEDNEILVDFEELEPGMVLARPLETAQGIPVAPRDMVVSDELIERLERFRDSNGLGDIYVWA